LHPVKDFKMVYLVKKNLLSSRQIVASSIELHLLIPVPMDESGLMNLGVLS